MKNGLYKSTKARTDYLAPLVKELIRIRIEKEISQVELAWQIGVTDYLVAKWECGIRTPSTFNLYCWADALDAKFLIIANDNARPPDCGGST